MDSNVLGMLKFSDLQLHNMNQQVQMFEELLNSIAVEMSSCCQDAKRPQSNDR